MGEHRVPLLGSRRFEDPARSSDPTIRAIVAQLQTLDPVPPPRAHFKAELRAQLVAVAPRLVAEGVAAETSAAPAATVARASLNTQAAAEESTRRRSFFGRPLAIVTACVALLGILLGGATVLSRHALPGDTLYSLKRASENLELATASSPGDKAADLLSFATNRTNEVLALLADDNATPNNPASVSPGTAALVRSTLSDADSELRQASRAMSALAVSRHSGAPLQALLRWAPGQLARFQDILDRLPSGPLADRADASQQLVEQARSQAARLAAVAGCATPTTSDSNGLGPIPVSGCGSVTPPGVGTPAPTSVPTTSAPRGTHSAPAGTHGTTPVTVPSGGGAGTGGGQGGATSTTPAPAGSTTTGNGGLPSLPLPLPTVPTTIPPVKVPTVSTGSCGITAGVPGLGLTLGPCGISANIGH
ncbi:MAG: DUF5667 domain-containing protein [Jatrophihabitans sp.]|uniref:DUF5667 domain-containing protein n=1 Tax=Jatrophihabitans sp. TaxID=1932789 RepID=UPI003F7FCB20